MLWSKHPCQDSKSSYWTSQPGYTIVALKVQFFFKRQATNANFHVSVHTDRLKVEIWHITKLKNCAYMCTVKVLLVPHTLPLFPSPLWSHCNVSVRAPCLGTIALAAKSSSKNLQIPAAGLDSVRIAATAKPVHCTDRQTSGSAAISACSHSQQLPVVIAGCTL